MKKLILATSLLVGSILLCMGCSSNKKDWKDGLELETKTWSNPKKIQTLHILVPDSNDAITFYKDTKKMKVFADLSPKEGIYDRDMVIDSMRFLDVNKDDYDDLLYSDMNDDYKLDAVYLYDEKAKNFVYSEDKSTKTPFDPDMKKISGLFYIDGNINKVHVLIKPNGELTYYSGEDEVLFVGRVMITDEKNGYRKYYFYDEKNKRIGELCGSKLDEPDKLTELALDEGKKSLTVFQDSEHLVVTTRHGFTFYEKLYADWILLEATQCPENHYYLYDLDGNGIKELIYECTEHKEIFVYTAKETSEGQYECEYAGWIHPFGTAKITLGDGALLYEEYEGNEHTIEKMGLEDLKLVCEDKTYSEDSVVYEGEPYEGSVVTDLQLLIDNNP